MKRLLPIVLVIAALVLLAPVGVGLLVRQIVEQQNANVVANDPRFTIVTEQYEPGWFQGHSRHRVVVADPMLVEALKDIFGANGFGDQPAIVAESQIHNGPVPFTSLGEPGGSLFPALARVAVTMQVDPGNGGKITVPGRLTTRFGFTGRSKSRWVLEPGSHEFGRDGEIDVEWQGADVIADVSRDARDMEITGTIAPVSIQMPDVAIQLATIELDTRQSMTDYRNVWAGDVSYTLESVIFRTEDAAGDVTLTGITLTSDTNVDAGIINGTGSLSIDDIDTPDAQDLAFEMQISLEQYDAEAFSELMEVLQSFEDTPDAAQQIAMLAAVNRLAGGGARTKIEKLLVTLPQGQINATLDIWFDAYDGTQPFSPAVLMTAMHGDMLLELPEELVQMAMQTVGANPAAGAALAYLEKDGDIYRVKAEYENGVLSINGAPLPIPMPW